MQKKKAPIFPHHSNNIPDKGKYNLFSTFKDYNNQHPMNIQYNTMQQKVNQQITLRIKNDPNKNPLANKTSDIQKLDSFLSNNPYGQIANSQTNSAIQTVRQSYDSYSTQQKPFISYYKKYNTSQWQSQKSESSKHNNSHFFMGGVRFDSQNKHLKKTSYDDNYNKVNHVVSQNKVQNQQICKTLDSEKYQIKQPVCPVKLDRNIYTESNMEQFSKPDSPYKRKQLHTELKNQMLTQKEWYQQVSQKKRGQKILKNAYRSGIISVDNPENQGTSLYQQDYEKYLQQIQMKQKQADNRIEQLKKYRSSSQDIEFCQKQNQTNTNTKIVIRKKKPDMREYLAARKKISEPFMNKFQAKTQSMFEPQIEQYQQQNRTQLLEYQDKRNKGYDIVSIRKL